MDAGQISGAQDLIAWFGEWPTFHDAEVLELHLARRGTSFLRVLTWKTSGDQTNPDGTSVRTDHVIVSLLIRDILDLSLHDFSTQNVIDGLAIDEEAEGLRITLEPCFGLAGWIVAREVSVSFSPVRV